ncbi:hypothetical protein Poly51_06340 [Rubripirellula tenax]|uniref:Uncharacterized protein n=1 Tax=Rubripirellula tenax TaxID=2528015 RepID=A0A5C6FJX3_9BACT|nr:hypothetical protein [Rubripirellula tenax]TWU60359.1 hypothetical protein Poly51_06340 [Rubripirellula tenax]
MKPSLATTSALTASALWLVVFRLNWGLALFLAAIAPLALGVARLVQTQASNRWDSFWLIFGGLLLAYAFAPGPYVGLGQLYYQVTGSPGFWGEAFSVVFSPHMALSVGRFGSDQFNTGLWDYIVQWQILCS